MQTFLANLGTNLVSLCCVVGAAVVASNGRDGWGWFLFVGAICASSSILKED